MGHHIASHLKKPGCSCRLGNRIEEQVVHGSLKHRVAIEANARTTDCFAQHVAVGIKNGVDHRLHRRVNGNALVDRDQAVMKLGNGARFNIDIECSNEGTVTARLDNDGAVDPHRLDKSIVSVAAEKDIDTGTSEASLTS